MVVPMTWIRKNMIEPPEQYERQLTEAELKVLKSLKKLSIPDWYLNKRSPPPKILNNATPINCRPPTWKTPGSEKKSPEILSETFLIEERKDESEEQPTVMEEEPFDTTIPKIKLSTNISRTFPKVSPPRKIQNINIVFPPGPPLTISESLDDNAEQQQTEKHKFSTFVLKKQRFEVGARLEQVENSRRSRTNGHDKSAEKGPDGERRLKAQKRTITLLVPRSPGKSKDMSLTEENETCVCGARTDQTKEDEEEEQRTPRKGRTIALVIRNPSVLARLQKAREDALDNSERKTPRKSRTIALLLDNDSSTPNVKGVFRVRAASTPRMKPVNLFSSAIMEDVVGEGASDDSGNFTENAEEPTTLEITNVKELRSTSEQDETVEEHGDQTDPEQSQRSQTPRGVREYVRLINSWSQRSQDEKPQPVNTVLGKRIDLKVDQSSPSTRFIHARRKSTELENIVKRKQTLETGGGLVKRLVQAFERCSVTRRISQEIREDDGTGSDSDFHAAAPTSSASSSPKDTDSSDADQKAVEEDDSVYWIPVSKCELPRTSSLLSVKPSIGYGSPCVSPIRV